MRGGAQAMLGKNSLPNMGQAKTFAHTAKSTKEVREMAIAGISDAKAFAANSSACRLETEEALPGCPPFLFTHEAVDTDCAGGHERYHQENGAMK